MGFVMNAGAQCDVTASYVIVGENAGSKERKARELGIPILTEDEFLDMIK